MLRWTSKNMAEWRMLVNVYFQSPPGLIEIFITRLKYIYAIIENL